MFITFEGIDFCGKSTQVNLLRNYLESGKKNVEVIREPGGTEISEIIRDLLLDKKYYHIKTETEIFLFSASRAQLVRERINPLLEKDFYVISDRFHDSTTAYQGFGRGIAQDTVRHINELAIGSTIPDLTFFIDISVEESFKRKKLRSETELDRIEISSYEFFNRVRDGYLELNEKEKRFRLIDGSRPIDEIHNLVVGELKRFEKKEIA